MSRLVLKVDNVSKRYVTYHSMVGRVMSWFDVPIKPASEFWAVKDVSLQVNAGEAVAIIGANGAGKSTLLKMVTGTVRPTRGGIAAVGRISALLELGLGFNPEFTGRQNVYMSCGLMGFSVGEIDRMMDGIVAFAEIGDHFEQPLRTYSSGMQARVAFAVATAVRPDLLIVDEVLSVGDSYFQHKSFDRIRQFKADGAAIIFVTHGMSSVRSLCDRVILLDKGAVLKDGLPDEVVDYYNALVAEKENATQSIEQRRQKNGWLLTKSGDFKVVTKSLTLLDLETGLEVNTARVGQRLRLRLVVSVSEDVPQLIFGMMCVCAARWNQFTLSGSAVAPWRALPRH